MAALVPGTLVGHALATPAHHPAQRFPASKLTVRSILHMDLSRDIVTMRLHKGAYHGTPVWYIITDASDFGLAHDLNVNYAPNPLPN